MGPLLSDLAQKMQAKAENSDANAAKILIHSTHDTCLAGLSNTLDIFDERYVYPAMHTHIHLMLTSICRWPAFTAAVTFELFKKHTPAVQPASPWQNVLSMFGRDREPTEHCTFL